MQPQAFIFDVFGTLVDWRSSIAALATRRFAALGLSADPAEFADAWRGEYQPAMERIRSEGRAYVPLDLLHRENLDVVLDRFGLAEAVPADARIDWARDWERLDPWPDAVPGLAALRPLGLLAPCSNGSIALMSNLARHGDLRWDAILGADMARDYKPKPAVYHASAAAFGLDPAAVMMIAAHEDDLQAARAAGLQTGYIPRPTEFGGSRDARPTQDWDIWAPTLPELAAALSNGN